MKLCVLILIATMAVPVQAQVASLPNNFELPKPTKLVGARELEETERRYRLSDRFVFTIHDRVIVGRVPVQPIPSYAGSPTYIRRVLGLSVRWRF